MSPAPPPLSPLHQQGRGIFTGHFPPAARAFLLYFVLALAVVALYLVVAQSQNGAFGFPLDDAWIHQVYARNLGTRGEFAFFPGQPSAGSTSPLWSIVLAVGYAANFDFRVWTILCGVLLLAGTGWLGGGIARHLTNNAFVTVWLVPIFLILEWHLVWAAASGMEILLFIFLSLALVEFLYVRRHPLWLGALVGLLALTRPEGVILGVLVSLALLLQRSSPRPKFFAALYMLLAFALFLIPYLAFNLVISGTLLPNTFYAKASEYAELAQAPFITRWLNLYVQPLLLGAQILLLPGVIYLAWILVRGKKWDVLLPMTWIVVLPLLYAWRLPVVYQFGRYLMPIIPFVILYGVVGAAEWIPKIRLKFIGRAWALTSAALVFVFFYLGLGAYSRSVAFINCEMVATAQWTAANLPRGELIAVHDIGAQGYFDSRPILDLAGLVSPEVIPIIRDQPKLLAWMQSRGTR